MSALTLVDIAAEINHEHQHALDAAHSAVRRARRAGELLLEAKDRCEHGDWLPWLKTNCPKISERTAQAYMRVARKCRGDEGKAEQLELLTLGEALEQLVEAKPISATAADFDPLTFKRRQAAIDDSIQRIANRMFADFKSDTDGLDRFERAKAWMATLNSAPADIPLIERHVTIGSLGDAPDIVLIESREHPGYWHDIDVRHGSASKRPVKPLGLAWRFAGTQYTWTTAPDDGTYLAYCGEVAP